MTEPAQPRPLGSKEGVEVSQSVLETLANFEAFDLEGDDEFATIVKRLKYGGATLARSRTAGRVC